MAVSNAQIVEFLLANPNMSDADIAAAMATYGVSPAQMAQAVGLPEGEVISRVAATIPEGSSLTLGDTNIAPQYQVIGSGEDRQVLGIENIYTMKTDGDVNYKAPVGSEYQVLNPDGTFQSTGTVKKDQSFLGGLVDAFKDPVVLAALGGAAAGGLLGGAGAATGAGTAAGTAGMTAAELAQLDLALGGAGGTAGATSLGSALATGAPTATLTNLTGGSGATTVAPAGVDYSLTGSTPTTPTTNMGGAQGLQGGTSANLPTMGGGQGITLNVGAPSTTLADAIATIGGAGPSNLVTMGGGQGLTLQTPTGLVTSTGTIPIGGLTGVNNVIGQTGINTATNIGSTIGTTIPTTVIPPTVVTPPVVPPTPPVTPPTPPTVPPTTPVVPPVVPPTISDVIKTIGTVATVASLVNAVNPPVKTTTPTGFDIVPIPEDWKTPNKPTTAPFTALTPIDFGTRNLLKGTQWEKFLDPNYGKVPEPVKFAQPSNLSYNDLMGILGSKQGMPPASSLTINDIISGIQNQYGQANRSAMG